MLTSFAKMGANKICEFGPKLTYFFSSHNFEIRNTTLLFKMCRSMAYLLSLFLNGGYLHILLSGIYTINYYWPTICNSPRPISSIFCNFRCQNNWDDWFSFFFQINLNVCYRVVFRVCIGILWLTVKMSTLNKRI